jgi:AcrR family transcriptional regulator
VAKAALRPGRPQRSTTDLASGRAKQKARTRQALVDAAMAFVREGQDFSIAEVADAAGVGRTTAYCYFPCKDALFTQAVLTLVAGDDYPDFYEIFGQSTDVAARVVAVVETSDASITRHEAQYRAMLRLSLEADQASELPRRPAYRRQWLSDALAPLREASDRQSWCRLVAALSLCVGIEAHICLRDVCGLTPDEARGVKRWAAKALLRAALTDTAPAEPTTRARPGSSQCAPASTR